jgi:hypothetical protein
MARQDAAPEPGDHRILHRAHEHAHSIEGEWRMRYGLPLTDPRWLDATEEEIVEDLLGCMYWDARVRRATVPTERTREGMEQEPEAFDAVDAAIREALEPDGELGRRLQPKVERVERLIASIRLGGRVIRG